MTTLPIETRGAALEKARELAPRIRARAAAAEAERAIPRATIEELTASGLFHLLTPRRFGGSELGFAALVDVTTELAAACGSTGWVYGVLAGHSWLLNHFPIEAQRETLEHPEALTATVFRLGGRITPRGEDFHLVGGEGRFCSGIDHAHWIIVGNAVSRADGSSEPRFFLIPRRDIEIVDDWHTAGMRGTGSRSIRIAEAVIPAHRSVLVQDLLSGHSPGARHHEAPLYRHVFHDVAPFSLVGAPLGMARAAIRAFSEHFGAKLRQRTEEQAAAQSPTIARLGRAAADVEAAQALTLQDAAQLDAASGPQSLTPLDRARIARNWAYAAQSARSAVDHLFQASGGGSIYAHAELQRIWRDVNAAAQHIAFSWDNAMTNFGRVALGLKPLPMGPQTGR